MMRDEFKEIVSGWTLIDGLEDLTDRIERAALWAKENGPLLPQEEAVIKMMIECQIARGQSEDLQIENSLIQKLLKDIGVTLTKVMPPDHGFCLFIFGYGPDKPLFYASSAMREDILKVMDEFKVAMAKGMENDNKG